MGTIVTQYTFTVGTIDLRSLCGQGCPDCSECCETTVCCCANPIPNTLHFTLTTDNGRCPNGATGTLTGDSGTWTGTVDACGDTWSISLTCLSMLCVWQCTVTTSAGCNLGSNSTPATSVCDPLDLVFNMDVPGCLCPAPNTTTACTVTVEITL
jgi:hypothetical protein